MKQDWENKINKFYGCMFEDGDYNALVDFIRSEIQKAEEIGRKNAIQECINLSDEIESNTTFDEWRAFKRFRNKLRDNLK